MLTLFFLKIKDANIIYKITKNKKKKKLTNEYKHKGFIFGKKK